MSTGRDPSTELIAFVDESKKPARDPHTGQALAQSWYAMAAVIALAGQAEALRAHLVEIGGTHNSGLHYSQMTNAARRAALRHLNGLVDWDAQVVEIERPVQIRHETTVRRAVLATLLQLAVSRHGVTSIVIESRSRRATTDTLDLEDRALLTELARLHTIPSNLALMHARKDEPMLWLPDLIVGARTDAMSGSDWRPWAEVVGRVDVGKVPPRWRGLRSAEAPGH